MLKKITYLNSSIFDQLIQDYEGEFASITGKKKNQVGKYPLDYDWKSPNEGFYWLEKDEIVGFCVMGNNTGYLDIFEFYVIPAFRGKGIGEKMAFAVFDAYPGKWQVRQIEGADKARNFWIKTISNYNSGDFKEYTFIDPYWGPVTCQRFENTTR